MVNQKIIIALDSDDKLAILKLVEKIDPTQCRLKIGKATFTLYGPDFVRDLIARGFDIFLDLKFHDIPYQVAEAVKAAAKLGVWMTNVHASGGGAMLLAAAKALKQVEKETGKRPLLIGVTLLTSLSESDINKIGYSGRIENTVVRFAKSCADNQLDGVVCSAQEAALIKKNCGSSFLTVTPGIRLLNNLENLENSQDDQKRIMTPEMAIKNRADFLVIGRPISQAPEPQKVINQIINQISNQVKHDAVL